MGNRFVITVTAENSDEGEPLIDEAVGEIQRIESLLTTFSENSQTNQINKNVGIKAVKVELEVFELIERAQRISELTDGAFDLSYGSLDKKFWNFDKLMTELPDPETAKAKVRLINFKNIVLDKSICSVFLKEKGMRIGFGGIGKGYAADRAANLLKSKGVKSGIVNASGDLITWGNQPNGEPWTISLAHPDLPTKAFSKLNISNLAVATSGNYEKFVVIDGKKYSHTINPKTGYPVSGIKSVSIICPIAELADALATPVTIMGVEAGINLINQLNSVECVIIDDNNYVYKSNNVKID
ncbi:FAD:protein FMN transferase [Lacihabitans soyangensis]|uniref:FAD:protein FMN transferase n=1 Tax=Lacihabitans soyangensis TaxID=869394 RepID=A0AAE3H036_9BACT|nr:FAD:protein FMN transferase [Lacihabitans soyangensis]MCP9762222.1 FAD:protein FMN transferase [Lacihabitans soyangensis]